MAKYRSEHPYLDLFTSSLASPFRHGQVPDHDHDPPRVEDVLPLSPARPEARPLLELLLGADHDLRDDHSRAAGINLALAETRIRMAMRQDGSSPALEGALAGILRAREELAQGKIARACAAVTDAARSVVGSPAPRQG